MPYLQVVQTTFEHTTVRRIYAQTLDLLVPARTSYRRLKAMLGPSEACGASP